MNVESGKIISVNLSYKYVSSLAQNQKQIYVLIQIQKSVLINNIILSHCVYFKIIISVAFILKK
jgi:hypothetical protein